MSEAAVQDPVREYFQSVYGLKLEIARLTERVRTLQAQCEKMTTVLTGMPRGGSSDPERLMALLADERAALDARLLQAEGQTRRLRILSPASPTACIGKSSVAAILTACAGLKCLKSCRTRGLLRGAADVPTARAGPERRAQAVGGRTYGGKDP